MEKNLYMSMKSLKLRKLVVNLDIGALLFYICPNIEKSRVNIEI